MERNQAANYRQRIRQAHALGEFGLAEESQAITCQGREHQIDLAIALGEIAASSRRGRATRPS